jgi:hypothetical protein
MSPIRTQISIIHQDSNLSATASLRRDAAESSFSSDAVTITSTPEQVLFSPAITPREVFLTLLSGDQLQVGFASGVYPIRLSEPGDATLLPLDVAGRREITLLTAGADVAAALNGKYFDLSDRLGPVRVWISVDGTGTPPSPPSGGRLVEVGVVEDSDANTVAAAVVSAFGSDAEISCLAVASALTFTDKHTGTRGASSAGNIGWGAPTQGQAGAASGPVWLQSTGSSQIVVAVAPA